MLNSFARLLTVWGGFYCRLFNFTPLRVWITNQNGSFTMNSSSQLRTTFARVQMSNQTGITYSVFINSFNHCLFSINNIYKEEHETFETKEPSKRYNKYYFHVRRGCPMLEGALY